MMNTFVSADIVIKTLIIVIHIQLYVTILSFQSAISPCSFADTGPFTWNSRLVPIHTTQLPPSIIIP